jgi:hypothetical protein
MAAREHELEPLVGERGLLQLILHGVGDLEQLGLRRERLIAPDAVDRAVASGRDEPAPGLAGAPLRGHRSAAIANAC